MYAEGMGKSIVILNTKELAVHLLEVKSSVFSSRSVFRTEDMHSSDLSIDFRPI